jgi:hypothetical protein
MLCDRLFQALRQKIPGLQIKNNDEWSSIWSTGAVIAWVSYGKIRSGITVWFIGDSEKAKKISASALALKTTSIASAWGNCCGSFMISKDDQIAEAVEMIFAVSCHLSSFDSDWASAAGHENVSFFVDHNQQKERVYKTA